MSVRHYLVWAVQWRRRSGWITLIYTVSRTRSEAIAAFKGRSRDGDKYWLRERNAGRVRCIHSTVCFDEGNGQ